MMFSPAFAHDLEFRRVDQLYRQNATAPVLIFLSIIVFLIVGWNHIPHVFLITWAVVWLASGLLRAWMTWKWNRAKAKGTVHSMADLNRWSWVVIGGCIVSSSCYGSLGVASRLYLGPEEQLYLGVLILGACSGTVAAYSLSLASSLGSLLPAVLIWGIGLVYAGTPWPMLLFLVAFTFITFRLAKNWNTYAKNSLRMNLDLHQKEERLRLAMDSSGAASWAWDPHSDSFFCDTIIAQVLGESNSSFHCLQDYLLCVHPEDRPAVNMAFFNALQVGDIDIEHRLSNATGDCPRFVALRGRVQGGAGALRRVSGIAWDVTNKMNEERVRFERNLFEKANHAKLMFLANVSHEIRTPLTAINGFAENILNDHELPHRFHEQLNVVLRSGKYLSSVVHDLLDLSKAEADSIYIQKSNLNLAEEINDSLHVVRTAIERKNLKLNVIYDSFVPEVIVSDGTRLRQILINLLSNSVKYTENGQINIRVSFVEGVNSGRLRIVVSDTGFGMSERDIRNLFQPFTRGESQQVRQRQGSGLGLVLSRSLALRMGGDLRLLSTVLPSDTCEGGTAFELTIDVGPCDGVRRLQKHPLVNSASSHPLTFRGQSFENRRFMLVEDDEDIRWLLQEYLQKRGANVVLCRHGAEAVQAAFGSNFDAVLMDIKMPVMDGYQATSLLRQRGFRSPIVALTAHANSSDMMLCYEAGCDFYLSKPVDFGHLNDVLKRCLDVPILTTS